MSGTTVIYINQSRVGGPPGEAGKFHAVDGKPGPSGPGPGAGTPGGGIIQRRGGDINPPPPYIR